jgi:hypothetical protein
LSELSWRLRLRFGNALLFYGLLALSVGGGLLLPPIAAVTGVPWVNVNYLVFLLHWWPMSVCLIMLMLLLRRRGLLRPRSVPVFSWETWIYVLSRWPIVGWGVWAALLQRIRPKPLTFKVTPKAIDGVEPLPTGLILPYAAIIALLSVAALFGEFRTAAVGYVGLCLLGALTYSMVALVVCGLHAQEAARSTGSRVLHSLVSTARQPLTVTLVALLPLLVALPLYPSYALTRLG